MNVTVYSTTNCGTCHAEMQWLDSIDVSYEKKVVDEDPKAMDEFMTVNEGIIGTPFTTIENEGETTRIAGFDRSKLKAALNI